MSPETAITAEPAATAHPGEIPAAAVSGLPAPLPAKASFAGISSDSSSAINSISSA